MMADTAKAVEVARNHAPYLAESLELHPDIAKRMSDALPEAVFADLVADLPPTADTLTQEMGVLRRFKRQAHLVIALSDLSGTWDWVGVTEYLTQLADICMARLLCVVAGEAEIDGTPDNPVPGFFVLAVGKYGARELNYSSDIDFNIFYDPTVLELPNPRRAERTLIRLTQSLIKGFEAMTEDGYIFRTDLRLRPDPRSNAIAVSTLTAERYYETIGQNWERAAMIKARVCGGDMSVGQAFIDEVLSPFIWRRNLDYAAIEDILAIKRQIHAHKTGHDIKVPGHHLKLGVGGIREIEFYAQVQQLILGGRNPDLRLMRTVDTLKALSEIGYVDPDDAHALCEHYGVLRDLEHRTQMVADAQTHILPQEDKARLGLAALAGFDNLADFDADVLARLQDVHDRYVALFPEAKSLSSRVGSLVFTGVEPGPETLDTLSRLGFEQGNKVWREMSSWLGGRIQATRTERAREYLTSLAPHIIDDCADTGQPDVAFAGFAQFFTNLRAGVSVLSMFNQTPDRLRKLIFLMSQSPRIADRLAEQPAILDSMTDPSFLHVSMDALAFNYVEEVGQQDDFETALNTARRCVREDHFRITVGALSDTLSLDLVPLMLTRIAEQSLAALLPVAIREVERVAGPVKGNVAVLGLGKLGGREMSITSDLDIMILFEADQPEEANPRTYAKITQRLISALSSVTEEGRLFEVDMALRPSGRSGPVAVSIEAFESYYAKMAWTWEFMALTRARVVAATTDAFATKIETVLKDVLCLPRPDLDMATDVADMLRRVKAEKAPKSDWDIKSINGGMRDIEFLAQNAYLQDRNLFKRANITATADMLRVAVEARLLPESVQSDLKAALTFYHEIRQLISLMQGEGGQAPTEAVLSMVAHHMSFEDAERLSAQLNAHTKHTTGYVNTYIF